MLADRWIGLVALAVVGGLLGGCGPDGSDHIASVAVPADAIDVLASLEGVTRVVDMHPRPDGGVWVLDSQPPYFVVVGPEGEIQREFGQQGGGPDEFDRPVALVGIAGSTDVWAYDWVRNALIEISPDSRRSLALPRDTIPVPSLVSFRGAGINPAPPWLEGSEDGFLLARARTPQAESALHLWNVDVLRITSDESGVNVDVVAPLADRLGEPQSEFGAASVLIPYPLWSSCRDGALGLYDPLRGVLRRFGADGEEMAPLTLPEPRPVAMTPDLVFEMFYRQFAEDRPGGQTPAMEEMRRLTEDQNREFVRNSSEYFPEYSELRCDDQGEFWLRRFDPQTGRLGLGPDWLRVSSGGSQTLVSLPDSFRVFRIDQDRMWGTLRDELGAESVAVFDLSAL